MLCVMWAEIDPSMYQLELISSKAHRMREWTDNYLSHYPRRAAVFYYCLRKLCMWLLYKENKYWLTCTFFKVQIKECILKGEHGRYCLTIFWICTSTREKINCFLVVFIKSLVRSSTKSCQFKKFQSQHLFKVTV